jgi:hypothetical protein
MCLWRAPGRPRAPRWTGLHCRQTGSAVVGISGCVSGCSGFQALRQQTGGCSKEMLSSRYRSDSGDTSHILDPTVIVTFFPEHGRGRFLRNVGTRTAIQVQAGSNRTVYSSPVQHGARDILFWRPP